MNRLVEWQLAGKTYYLNFSQKAARLVSERYGSIENVSDIFEGKPIHEVLSETNWLLTLLIDQGAAYKKVVFDEEVPTISAEDLEVVMGLSDLSEMTTMVMGAITKGMSQTVEVEPSKNDETTQGE